MHARKGWLGQNRLRNGQENELSFLSQSQALKLVLPRESFDPSWSPMRGFPGQHVEVGKSCNRHGNEEIVLDTSDQNLCLYLLQPLLVGGSA